MRVLPSVLYGDYFFGSQPETKVLFHVGGILPHTDTRRIDDPFRNLRVGLGVGKKGKTTVNDP